MDRRALFASATAAALLAATGVCAAGPQRGGRLRMALSGASRSDSWTNGNGLFMQIARQGVVFDTLTEVASDGTLRGELATGWTSNESATQWRFDLRTDVFFHDGTPFTARDVVATAAGFEDGQVRATGSHQVSIKLNEPDPGLPMRFAQPEFYISAAHAPNSGIGTGMYRVAHFTPGQRLLALRMPQHFKDGKAGWFDEVELTSMSSEPVRGQALSEYLVDAVDLRDADHVAGISDIISLPDAKKPMQAVSDAVLMPTQIGYQRPLDNLRAAERWWFG